MKKKMRNYGKKKRYPSISTSLEADPKDGSTPEFQGTYGVCHQPVIIGCLDIQPLLFGPETLVLLE